jgi:hypothetical protein
MDQPHTPAPTIRHDGWTPERRTRFLDQLAARGNVRAACASVGMSREAAYKLRRREPLFARGWDAALELARDLTAETLGDRAIDGIEEEVWYRGELLGTRRRYDTRLLLAHMARLDKLAEQREASRDAARFDEILACLAGEPVPEELGGGEGELPPERHEAIALAEKAARQEVDANWPETANDDGYMTDEEHEAFLAESDAAARRAGLEAAARWDEWHARALAAVDALQASGSSPRTVSDLSTSPDAAAPLSDGSGASQTC